MTYLNNFILTFTGTREGMTDHQKTQVANLVRGLSSCGINLDIRTGGCCGSDEQAVSLCVAATRRSGRTIMVYPGDSGQGSSALWDPRIDLVFPQQPYLERNKVMVNGANLVIATPKESSEVRRSGTWATIRYARKTGVPVVIFYP